MHKIKILIFAFLVTTQTMCCGSVFINSYVYDTAAAPALPVPLQYSPVLWLDATDAWPGAEPTNLDNIGGAGEEWQDKSGNGYDLEQSTGTAQPTYKTNILNGLPGIYFDGGDLLQTAAAQTVSQGFTAFVVSTLDTASTGYTWFGSYNSSNRCVFYSDGGKFTMFAGSNARCHVLNANDNYHSLVWDGASSKLYENGVLKASPSTGTASLNMLTLGAFYNGAAKYLGYIYEVIIYDSVLSDTDRQAIESYLATKWGL